MRIIVYVLLLAALLVGCERVVSIHPAWLWNARASAPMCEVYRDFFRHIASNGAGTYVRSGTTTWRDTVAGYAGAHLGANRNGPELFNRGTGLGKDDAQREQFSVETSSYFAPVTSDQPLFIRDCFVDTAGIPQFYDGPPVWLELRDIVVGGRAELNVWLVSPVGISPDGANALLYAEINNTGGVFFLLERRGAEWVPIGNSVAWIS